MHQHLNILLFFHAQYVTGMRYQKLSSNLELFRNFSTAFAQSKLQINPSLVNTFEYMFAYVSNAGRSFFMWFLRCFHDFFSHGFAPQFQFLQKLIGQRSASTHFNMGSDHAPTWFCISHLSTSHSVFSHCICIGSFSGTEWYDACLPEQCWQDYISTMLVINTGSIAWPAHCQKRCEGYRAMLLLTWQYVTLVTFNDMLHSPTGWRTWVYEVGHQML